MSIDTSGMAPEDAMQVSMFETLIDAMPLEALELLEGIIHEKVEARRKAGGG